jgi:diguanylate cyclase (GGDEF)-like protein/PAS domain S-box-containing protein
MIGEDGQLVYVSPSCERMLGYSREEMMAMPPRALLPEEERENAQKMIMGAQAGLAETGRFVHRLRTKAGDLRWFETYYCLVREGTKKTTRIHLTSRDINERRMQENASKAQADLLRNLSLRDELTALYNRRGFLEHAQQALRSAARAKQPACLFYVDLNGMKRINDTLGHQMGDRAIVATAQILSRVFRDSDIVARLGGDEFAILAAACGREQVAIVRKRLMAAIAELNQSRKEPFQLSVSVGEGIYDPQAPSTLEDLMESADRAMYEEKRARGQRTASIDPHAAPSPRE